MKTLRDLKAEDVPESLRPWFERAVVEPVNEALEVLRETSSTPAVNRQWFSRTLTAPSSWATSDYIEVLSTLRGECREVRVVRARVLDAAGVPTTGLSPVACVWDEKKAIGSARSLLVVTSISGLTASVRYQVDFCGEGE